MRGTTRDLSDKHEKYLVEVLGGRMTRGSGNQWHNQMDGRHDHRREEMALAWDAKSTLGKSIGVSLEMWRKAQEQSHGERPCLPLRFYLNERLTEVVDLVVLSLDDLVELLDRSRRLGESEMKVETGVVVCEECGSVFSAESVPEGMVMEHSEGAFGPLHHIKRA